MAVRLMLALYQLTHACLLLSIHQTEGVRTVSVLGAGASFPNEVYKHWIPSFQANRSQHVTLHMKYDSVGSGNGRKRILQPDADRDVLYAGSDSLLSQQDYTQHPGIQMFPVMAGAVVVAYNLPSVPDLTLSIHHVVGIYNGSITMWNDSTIQELNPHTNLPDEKIIVTARSDKSGTTEIFTKGLSRFDENWNNTYGVFNKGLNGTVPYHWNKSVINYYGYTNRGLSGLVLSLRYSIAYLAASDAYPFNIKVCKIQNKAGHTVEPNTTTVQNAMDDFAGVFSDRLTLDITNAKGNSSYPLSGFTYFIIYLHSTEPCDSIIELYRYIEWFLFHDKPRAYAQDYYFVPVSKQLASLIKYTVLNKMICGNANITEAVLLQKQKENSETNTWLISLYITIPIICVLLFAFIIYVIWNQVRMNRAIIFGEWKIEQSELAFYSSMCFSGSFAHSLKSRSTSSSRKSLFSGSLNNSIFARYKNGFVNVTLLNCANPGSIKTKVKKSILHMKNSVSHNNILKFLGISYIEEKVHAITEIAEKGRLHDIVQNDKYDLNNNLKFLLSIDVATGMSYLHSMGIVHGHLTSDHCYLDQKWNVKIGDWQNVTLQSLIFEDSNINLMESSEDDEDIHARNMFWVAPELLDDQKAIPNKASDVYSFAILLTEIFSREDPYCELTAIAPPSFVLNRIRSNEIRPIFPTGVSDALIVLVKACWSQAANKRPDYPHILKQLKRSSPSKKSVLDCMMEVMQDYTSHLEDKVEERTKELNIAMEQLQGLLNKMLPPTVAEKLASGQMIEPESCDKVTVCFVDVVEFTTLCAESSPLQVVHMLNELYTLYDDVLNKHDVYKMETIGDSYMIVSGIPKKNGDKHVIHIANVALDMMQATEKFKIHHKPNRKLKIRSGCHSGSVVGGVVGLKMPRYTLFGDTVNTASRMESTSLPSRIQVSQETYSLLDAAGGFLMDYRGPVHIKGKGEMVTYWLVGKTNGFMVSVSPSVPLHTNESNYHPVPVKGQDGY